MEFRDLNGNGALDPYEDPRRPIDERVEDLLAQMTLEEKAGLMYHTPIGIDAGRRRCSRSPRRSRPIADARARPRAAHQRTSTSTGRLAPREVAALAQPPAGARRGDAARDPGDDLDRPAARLQRQPGDEHVLGRVLAVAGADRPRRRRRRGARARSSATSRGRSTWRSASASRCTRRPTSAPSRAGRAPRAPSARTPSSRRGCSAAYIRGFQGDELGPHERRVHDQALPRRRPAGRRRGSALRLPARSRSTRATTSSTTCSRSRRRSRPGPRRSCPTTDGRSEPSSRRSASASTAT